MISADGLTTRIPVARMRSRPYLHLGAGAWDRLRDRLAATPTPDFQFCRHDSRPGPDRPARGDAAVLESAAFVAAVTGTPSDLQFLRLHLDMSYTAAGVEPLGERRGALLAAWGFAYDVLGDEVDEPTRDALRRTIRDQAVRCCEAAEERLSGDWALDDPEAVAALAGLLLAGLAVVPEEPEAWRWLNCAEPRLRRVLAEVAADGWWPTGFEDWNLLLPLLVRVVDAWQRLTDEDRFAAPLFEEAWCVALHGLAPTGHDALDLDRVGRPGTSRPQATAEGRPGSHYRWLREPCRWALSRLGRRFPGSGFRLAVERWRQAGLGRGTPFGVLWPDEPHPGSGTPPATHHVFAAHGLAVWRRNWEPGATALALATGPAHGRRNESPGARARVDADANHFLLWALGQPLAGDTGALDDPGAALHNTVLVDGHGQVGPAEARFDPAQLASAWMTARGGLLSGQAGGCYPPEAFVRRFDRRLAFTDGWVLVWDHLHSARRGRYEWLLHGPGGVQREDDGTAKMVAGDASLWVQVLRPSRVGLEVRRAVAPGTGTHLGCALRTVALDPVEQTQFLVLLRPRPTAADPPAPARLRTGDGCVGARLAHPDGGGEEILFATQPGGIVLEHLRSDASYLALRLDGGGDWTRLMAHGAEAVMVPGGTILGSTQAVDVALEAADDQLAGEVASTTGATVALRCPFAPRGVLVDGQSGKARIDRAARRVTVRLTAGSHQLRITGR